MLPLTNYQVPSLAKPYDANQQASPQQNQKSYQFNIPQSINERQPQQQKIFNIDMNSQQNQNNNHQQTFSTPQNNDKSNKQLNISDQMLKQYNDKMNQRKLSQKINTNEAVGNKPVSNDLLKQYHDKMDERQQPEQYQQQYQNNEKSSSKYNSSQDKQQSPQVYYSVQKENGRGQKESRQGMEEKMEYQPDNFETANRNHSAETYHQRVGQKSMPRWQELYEHGSNKKRNQRIEADSAQENKGEKEALDKHCTFKPKTNRDYNHINHKQRDLYELGQAMHQVKQKQAQQQIEHSEIKEMTQCTFKPKLNKQRPMQQQYDQNKCQLQKGFLNFYRRQKKAQQMNEDKNTPNKKQNKSANKIIQEEVPQQYSEALYQIHQKLHNLQLG